MSIRKTLRIAVNASMLDDEPTGVGVYTLNLINYLAPLHPAQSITVFSPTSKGITAAVRVHRLPILLQSSRFGKVAAICRFIWNLVIYPLHARRFDVLISPTTHGSLFTSNQILTIHDLLSLKYNHINFHQRMYFKYVLPRMIKNARSIVAVSRATREDIVSIFGIAASKVHIIHNGIDVRKFHPVPDKYDEQIDTLNGKQPYILAVGPTYRHKNFELLVRSYAVLPASIRAHYRLLIAGGKEPYLSQIKSMVTALKLNKEISFLGYVHEAMMPALYRRATLLVFPSVYEGFGFPILEAMACGCPVLSSNTSSMPEVGGNAAHYFDPNDTNDLAAGLCQLLQSHTLRNHFAQKGLARVKLFSWQNTAAQIKAIYDPVPGYSQGRLTAGPILTEKLIASK